VVADEPSPRPFFREAPLVRTERLILRPFRPEDFEAFAAMHADVEVMKYISGGRSLPRHQSWTVLAIYLGHWQLRGYGQWAISDLSSGRFLGRVGLWRPEEWPGLELGWALIRDAWGQGLATEAADAALRFARERLGLRDVISLIQMGNRASERVAEKLGACADGTATVYGQELNVFRYKNSSRPGDSTVTGLSVGSMTG
jgi:RimJ/RimL family protein N-acetyltransferase